MAGHERLPVEVPDPVDRGREVERERIAEERGIALDHDVAGEAGAGVRHPDDEVVVGVGAAHVRKLDRAAADVDGREGVDQPVGRHEVETQDVVGLVGELLRGVSLLLLAGLEEERRAASVTPDRGGHLRAEKDCVAERVVRVAVRVDHDP